MNLTTPIKTVLDKLSPQDLRDINANVAAKQADLRRRDLERRTSGKPPQFTVVEIKSASEAKAYRENLSLKWSKNPHETLAELKREQAELVEQIEALKRLAAKYSTDSAVQEKIHGYRKRNPLVPGELPTFNFVEGLLPRAEEKLLSLDPSFEILKIECARYDADVAALKAWPPHRVAKELNLAADEAAILRGETPQKRGRF